MKPLSLQSKVLVINGSSQSRASLSGYLKEVGYVDVIGVNSPQDAVRVLEVEDIGWILSPMQLSDGINTIQMLKLCLTFPEFRHTKLSIFCDAENEHALPLAYEQGLLSHHPANFSRTAVAATLGELRQRLEAHQQDTCLVAAQYLRELLANLKLKDELLRFSKDIMLHFPGEAHLLLGVAEAQAFAGDEVGAASTLVQAAAIDPSLAANVDQTRARILPHLKAAPVAQGTNVLGVKSIVVVDPDEVVLKSVRDTFELIGAENILTFSSPDTALKHLQANGPPDIIIHEWRMPKIAGPIFIQKIRQLGFEHTPVILLSSLVTEKDQHLTREMGVAAVVPKPFNKEDLLKVIFWTVKQERRPTEVRVFERKLIGLLARRSHRAAQDLCDKAAKEQKIPPAAIPYFRAEIAYAQARYDKAKSLTIESLQQGFVSVRIYDLLGRVLIKLGELTTAIRCLERAQELSPLNILRLCLLADTQSDLGSADEARATHAKAEALDPTNERVQATAANIELTSGDIKRAKKIMEGLDNFDDMLRFLNNRGVVLARTGRPQEAVTFYQRALEALPTKAGTLTPVIRYNLSLSHARNGDLDGAVQILEQAAKGGAASLQKKAKSLLKRLKTAVKTGEALTLRTTDAVEPSAETDLDAYAASAAAAQVASSMPGDQCCYKIYISSCSPELRALGTKLPSYKPRASIVRESTGGLERDMKSGG